ncbi:MAG: TVP38/TMEM64 family protein [Candidatus Krumholzibacteria bacterium]|nr:TVP38/TMEM64 family protein [Candidatus Krumholzibacteria bacterium]
MDSRTAVQWRRRWRRIRLLLFPLLIITLTLLARHLGLGGDLLEFKLWILDRGLQGMLVYVLAFALAGAAALPGVPFPLLAGAVYGPVLGFILATIGSALAASISFLLARTLARDAVSRRLSGREIFRSLERATERNGPLVVILTRLFPVIPFALLNFGFGLTRLRFRTYLLWTVLSMMPGTVFYVVGADALTRGLQDGFHWRDWWLPVLVMLILLALLPWARRHLRVFRKHSDS